MPPRRRTPKRTRCMATNINRPCIRATGRLFFCQSSGSFSDPIMLVVIERVDSLEQAVQEFVRNVGAEFRKLYASQRQTEAELRLFKDEMRDFKDESRRSFGR